MPPAAAPVATAAEGAMQWETWTLFALTETVLCLTPGPAVLLVLSQALTRGTLASIWSNVGILTGNAFYFLLSAAGLGVILLASYRTFSAIRWVGAGYLIYLGLSAFFGRSKVLSVSALRDAPVGGVRMFINGFVLQVTNPKALVFFAALLPQFINPARGVALQVVILAATSAAIEFFVLAGYGALAGRMSRLSARPGFAKLTNRVAGCMLITAGVGMAAIRNG